MLEEELLREARLQTAILKAAFRDRIEAIAKEVDRDGLSAAIVKHLEECGRTQAGALKEAAILGAAEGTDASRRTISRRLADLENKGVVERIGQGRNTEYELTGLIG